jgi:hypothetical protein
MEHHKKALTSLENIYNILDGMYLDEKINFKANYGKQFLENYNYINLYIKLLKDGEMDLFMKYYLNTDINTRINAEKLYNGFINRKETKEIRLTVLNHWRDFINELKIIYNIDHLDDHINENF